MQVRILMAAAFLICAVAGTGALTRSQTAQAQPCGETTFVSDGVAWRVLFAKNGAVQQYLLQATSHVQERDHDALLAAQAKYGPEAINAPPVRIISFKPGDGGMMLPDKVIDSCGRVSHFH